jgi:hypothetical protein
LGEFQIPLTKVDLKNTLSLKYSFLHKKLQFHFAIALKFKKMLSIKKIRVYDFQVL